MHAQYLRTSFHLFEDVKDRFSRENVKITLNFREMTSVDDEDGYDGEGDRLLIADLTPICSTVKYYLL